MFFHGTKSSLTQHGMVFEKESATLPIDGLTPSHLSCELAEMLDRSFRRMSLVIDPHIGSQHSATCHLSACNRKVKRFFNGLPN